jgi:uncharacterized membrane protein
MVIAAAYLATLIVVVCLDLAWLTLFFGPKIVSPTLGDILLPHPNMRAGVAFYLLYPIGLIIFAVLPAKGNWTMALLYGALFGFFTYATYDITNYATLRNWTLTLAVMDVAWGSLMAGLAATAGGIAARLLTR